MAWRRERMSPIAPRGRRTDAGEIAVIAVWHCSGMASARTGRAPKSCKVSNFYLQICAKAPRHWRGSRPVKSGGTGYMYGSSRHEYRCR